MNKYSKFLGLERYKTTKVKLAKSNAKIKVHLKFERPCEELRKIKYKNRLNKSQKILNDIYTNFAEKFNEVKPLKSEGNIYGAKLELTFKELVKISKLQFIEWISITKIEGFKKRKLKYKKPYFSVVSKVLIDIEGIKKNRLSTELRIMLIQAKTKKEACQNVFKDFKEYEKPYFNPKGRIVQWKLIKIIDSYETDVYKSGDFKNRYGVEVYSKMFKKNSKRIFKKIEK